MFFTLRWIWSKKTSVSSFYKENNFKPCLANQLLNMFKLWCERGISDSLEQLKSSCSDATFRNIREFLKATVTELCNTLDSRRCKKRTLNGKYTSPQALRSHTSIITSSNDTATDRDTSPTPITTATTFHANHNTPPHPRKRRRRRRRNIRTTR